jgi:hypothetical protein
MLCTGEFEYKTKIAQNSYSFAYIGLIDAKTGP